MNHASQVCLLIGILVCIPSVGFHISCNGDTNASTDTTQTDVVEDAPSPDILDESTSQDSETIDQTDTIVPIQADVIEPGPHQVGFDEWTVTYTPDGSTEQRSLRVVFWYPTTEESGSPAQYFGLFIRNEVIQGAQIADDGPFPLLLFSHGNLGFAEQTFSMTEFFASHGWIVVSPDHTGNTFTDATIAAYEMMALRPQDISAILDVLIDPQETHRLVGQIGEDIVLTGHSFGGYTTLAVAGTGFDMDYVEEQCVLNPDEAACEYLTPENNQRFRNGFLDERIDLGIPMAPAGNAVFSDDGLAQVDVPILLMTGAMDATTTNAAEGDPIWAALNGEDDLRVDFDTAGHFTFSNLCTIFPSAVDGDGCGEEFVEPDEGFRLINAYALAYARYHLWADASVADILDGSEVLSEDVELMVHE